MAKNGFTLFEVLVSLLLLSIVMLGAEAILVKTLHHSRGLQSYQQALFLAENMAEYLRAHHGESEPYYSQWQEQVAAHLVKGRAAINNQQIHIQWGDEVDACVQKADVSGCLSLALAGGEDSA